MKDAMYHQADLHKCETAKRRATEEMVMRLQARAYEAEERLQEKERRIVSLESQLETAVVQTTYQGVKWLYQDDGGMWRSCSLDANDELHRAYREYLDGRSHKVKIIKTTMIQAVVPTN